MDVGAGADRAKSQRSGSGGGAGARRDQPRPRQRQDEAVVTVQVTSAEHEAEEGYFSLGDSTTVMVKPGTELYRSWPGSAAQDHGYPGGQSTRRRSATRPLSCRDEAGLKACATGDRRPISRLANSRQPPRSPARRCCSGSRRRQSGRRPDALLAAASPSQSPPGSRSLTARRPAGAAFRSPRPGTPGRRCGTSCTRSAQIRARLQVLLLL